MGAITLMFLKKIIIFAFIRNFKKKTTNLFMMTPKEYNFFRQLQITQRIARPNYQLKLSRNFEEVFLLSSLKQEPKANPTQQNLKAQLLTSPTSNDFTNHTIRKTSAINICLSFYF